MAPLSKEERYGCAGSIMCMGTVCRDTRRSRCLDRVVKGCVAGIPCSSKEGELGSVTRIVFRFDDDAGSILCRYGSTHSSSLRDKDDDQHHSWEPRMGGEETHSRRDVAW